MLDMLKKNIDTSQEVAPILKDEVESAINDLKNGKSPGIKGVTANMVNPT